MKALIAEDDLTSRLLMQELLKEFGTAHVAVQGWEAVEAVRRSLEDEEPYDLICLDIMMPEMDGQEALKQIRAIETEFKLPHEQAAKIIMITALGDVTNVMKAYHSLCDVYLQKPIHKAAFLEVMHQLGFSG
jgi:two-component system chemotaxis response regulator CheY